jgi:hypothetical protein
VNTSTNYGTEPGMHPAPMLIRAVDENGQLPEYATVENTEWVATYKLAYQRTDDWNVYALLGVTIKNEMSEIEVKED